MGVVGGEGLAGGAVGVVSERGQGGGEAEGGGEEGEEGLVPLEGPEVEEAGPRGLGRCVWWV